MIPGVGTGWYRIILFLSPVRVSLPECIKVLNGCPSVQDNVVGSKELPTSSIGCYPGSWTIRGPEDVHPLLYH
jgi:hypothetical protein